MKRGSKALRTLTPLVRRVGLAQVGRKRAAAAEAAGKPVRPALATRPAPAVPDDVRAALAARSGGRCELELAGCTGAATDPAHRISRKAGGRKGAARTRLDRLSNLLHACRTCHGWCHDNPVEAYEDGLMLREWHNPRHEPALYRGELSYLTEAGLVLPFEEAGP